MWGRKGLELFPGNGELMAGRAQAFCRIGDMKQAHALCDGSLQQAGQSAYRWLVRGEIMIAARQEMDRYCFDKAQELDADWLVPLEAARIELYYRRPSLAVGPDPPRGGGSARGALCLVRAGSLPVGTGLDPRRTREFSALPGAFPSPRGRRGATPPSCSSGTGRR